MKASMNKPKRINISIRGRTKLIIITHRPSFVNIAGRLLADESVIDTQGHGVPSFALALVPASIGVDSPPSPVPTRPPSTTSALSFPFSFRVLFIFVFVGLLGLVLGLVSGGGCAVAMGILVLEVDAAIAAVALGREGEGGVIYSERRPSQSLAKLARKR